MGSTKGNHVYGYAGRVLRVDLSAAKLSEMTLDEATLRKWLGGSGLGAKILYDEVPPEVEWSDPENRLILASGPLGGTRVAGSGNFSVVTVGAMTEGAATSQANGFMGAYMKLSGYDAVILHGQSDRWVYLYLHDGIAELRDATHLLGLDTYEMQDTITAELGKKKRDISVFGVGPAAEQMVRFAGIIGDHGHAAGHNGTGAVMGSKRVKAVVAARGPSLSVADAAALSTFSKKMLQQVLDYPFGAMHQHWGTSQLYLNLAKIGLLPVKNYTTNVFPEAETFLGERYRVTYRTKPTPCWACSAKHIHWMEITEGPYAGFSGEEPEYEQWAAWGSLIGNTSVDGAFVLSNEVDRLGLENNEAGWTIAWAMECYERGILTAEDTGGIELTWGNVEGVRAMLRKIARREGIGDLLAEGAKRASQRLGRGGEDLAVYTMKGNSPRGHDHRGRWLEMLDTSTSDTGTLSIGPLWRWDQQALSGPFEAFNPEQVAEVAARHSGWMMFEDCLGTCRFTTMAELPDIARVLSAATGWDFTAEEAITLGRRVHNLLRVFNIKRGLTAALESPSKKYGSTPVDGPVAGKSVAPHWESMRASYYQRMGWDPETGKPLPETLSALGLADVANDLGEAAGMTG